jgi:hypothetical protein
MWMRVSYIITVFLLGIFLCTCSKELSYSDQTKNDFTLYTIPANDQYSLQNSLTFTNEDSLRFIAIFDSTCIYSTTIPENQYDINKLYGFSDCDSIHLINSARIGWRWSDDSLRLFGFVHYNGNILSKEITTASIGSQVNCFINCDSDKYTFTVNNSYVELPRYCADSTYRRYFLYPYFGGDEKAPHEIHVWIKVL